MKKRNAPIDDEVLAEFKNFYLNHYMNWFGKGFWKGTTSQVVEALFPLTMSQIPMVNIYDDHDIIDGFGSYHDSTMQAPIFSTVGNVAYKYYMLFQHHMNQRRNCTQVTLHGCWVKKVLLLSKRTTQFL